MRLGSAWKPKDKRGSAPAQQRSTSALPLGRDRVQRSEDNGNPSIPRVSSAAGDRAIG
jgi:hypothetical protein